jgi:hypothetical protein
VLNENIQLILKEEVGGKGAAELITTAHFRLSTGGTADSFTWQKKTNVPTKFELLTSPFDM